MVVPTQQDEIVDVGWTAVASPHDVMGFAAGRIGPAADASTVANDQRTPLCIGGESIPVAEPQWLPVTAEHRAVQIRAARQPLDLRLRERPDAGDLGGTVGVHDHDHLGAYGGWSRNRPFSSQQEVGNDIGEPLLGRPPLGAAFPTPVRVVRPIDFVVEHGPNLGEDEIVPLDVQDPHLVGSQEPPTITSLSAEPPGSGVVGARRADMRIDLTPHRVGRLLSRDREQRGRGHRLDRGSVGGVHKRIEVGAGDLPDRQGGSRFWQRREELATSHGLIGLALGTTSRAPHPRGITRTNGATS